MKQLRQKLHSRAGVTVVFAMAVLLVCSLLCASLLSAAVSGADGAAGLREQEQAYLTLRSAARLLQKLADKGTLTLAEGRPVTVRADGLEPVEAKLAGGTLTLSIPGSDYSMEVALP